MRSVMAFVVALAWVFAGVSAAQQPEQGPGARRSIFEEPPPPSPPPPAQPARPGVGIRVAYVPAISAAGASRLPQVKAELSKAITSLKAGQGFAVVTARGGAAQATPASGLAEAASEEVSKAVRFVEALSADGGSTEGVVAAMEAAFARGPQLVYLLTDGRFDVGPVLDRLRALNRERRVRVNLILFAPANGAAVQPLRQIPAENGGVLKSVEPGVDDAQASKGGDAALRAEVAALRAEVAALRAEVAALREGRAAAPAKGR